MSNDNNSTALTAAIVCLVLGCVIMGLSLWTVFLYAPLFFAAFVLSIVAMTKKQIAAGVVTLLGTIILPLIIFWVSITLGLNSLNEEMESLNEEMGNLQEFSTNGNDNEDHTSYYSNQIDVLNFEAKYYESFLDGEVPGIRLRLRNNGDRVVQRVRLTVFFKDVNNNVIFEKTVTPFNSESIFEDISPLRPGYIWQMNDDEFLRIENVPDEWQEGNVNVELTGVTVE